MGILILSNWRQQLLRFGSKQSLQWHHNGRDGVSNHQPHDYLFSRLFRRRWKKTSKFRVTGLCAGSSPVTGEFPAQRASNAENASIWWRHHDTMKNRRSSIIILALSLPATPEIIVVTTSGATMQWRQSWNHNNFMVSVLSMRCSNRVS